MKAFVTFCLGLWGTYVLSGSLPVVQDGMQVHLMADHDANHIMTDMTIWGQPGNLGLMAALGNNHVLLSDLMATPVSCYKIETMQEIGVVLEYEGPDGDINLVAIKNGPNISGFIVSHMGVTPSWENRFAFGADMDNLFTVEMGDLQTDTLGYNNMSAESYYFHPFEVQKAKGSARSWPKTRGFMAAPFLNFPEMMAFAAVPRFHPCCTVQAIGATPICIWFMSRKIQLIFGQDTRY